MLVPLAQECKETKGQQDLPFFKISWKKEDEMPMFSEAFLLASFNF